MKVICSRDALLGGLGLVSSVVPVRDISPILRNVKLDVVGSCLRMVATDLETWVSHELRDVRVVDVGTLVVPAQMVLRILREATDDELVIESSHDHISISGVSSCWEIPLESHDSFPDVPDVAGGGFVDVSADLVGRMIRRTVFAASAGVSAFSTVCVLWELGDGELRLVATDGKRMALSSCFLNGVDSSSAGSGSYLVPIKALNLLSRHLSKLSEDSLLSFRMGSNDALFRAGDTVLYTRLVGGRFPPYRVVIPGGQALVSVRLESGVFLSAVRQSSIMVDEDVPGLLLRFTKGCLVLSARGSVGGRSKVSVPVEYDGSDFGVKLDPVYLIDMLRCVDHGSSFSFEFYGDGKPVLFRFGSDYLYLVMPMI